MYPAPAVDKYGSKDTHMSLLYILPLFTRKTRGEAMSRQRPGKWEFLTFYHCNNFLEACERGGGLERGNGKNWGMERGDVGKGKRGLVRKR